MLCAALLLAAALRFFEVGKQPMWLDEATTAHFAARELRESIFAEAQHPPLYYALMHFASRWIGDSDAALRVPSAIFGVLGVWAVWSLARRFFPGRPDVARFALLLAAVSPYMIYMSQEARSYSLVILLGLMATIENWRFLECGSLLPPSRREARFADESRNAARKRQSGSALLHSKRACSLLRYSLLSVALLLTHYFAAWLLLAHEITYWWRSRTRPWTWIAARVAVGAAFCGWVWWAITHLHLAGAAWIRPTILYIPLTLLRYLIGFGVAAPNSSRLTDAISVIIREEGLAVLLVAGPLLLMLAFGVRELLKMRTNEMADGEAPAPPLRALFACLLVMPPAALLAISPIMNLLHDRNLAWQAPFVTLLAALGLASLQGRARWIASLACGAALVFSLYAYYAAPVGGGAKSTLGYGLRYGKEDWRSAVEYVRAQKPDAVILAPEYIRIAFDRYWRAAEKQPAFYYSVVDSGGVPNVGNARRVVLVLSHEGFLEEGLSGPGGLARDRNLVIQKVFPAQSGIRVFVYDAPEKKEQMRK